MLTLLSLAAHISADFPPHPPPHPLLQNLLNRLLTVDLPGLMVLPQRLEISIPPSVTSIAEAAVGRDTIMRAVASAVLQVPVLGVLQAVWGLRDTNGLHLEGSDSTPASCDSTTVSVTYM